MSKEIRMKKYIYTIAAICLLSACGVFKRTDYGAGVEVKPLAVVALQPINLTPVSSNVFTGVKTNNPAPVAVPKPEPIPVTNTIIVQPVPVPTTKTNNLIAGDGGCVKHPPITNNPPVIAGEPPVIEPVPLTPIPIEPIPVDTIKPILVEEIQLTEVELPETSVIAWGLVLYYIAAIILFGATYLGWKRWQSRKVVKKRTTTRKRRKRTPRKKS